MKNIKILYEYFIALALIYYFIIKPILWMIDHREED
jgi:F0F1-type ATP synthase membrane subunit b/b'